MIRAAVRSLIILILTVTTLLLVLAALVIQDKPLVSSKPSMSFYDLDRAQKLWRDFQPAKLQPGKSYELDLKFKDAELLMLFAASQHPDFAYANFKYQMQGQDIKVQATQPLDVLGAWGYLNLTFNTQIIAGSVPRMTHVVLGNLKLPEFISTLIQENALSSVDPMLIDQWQSCAISLNQLPDSQNEMRLGFTWLPGSNWETLDEASQQKLVKQLASALREELEKGTGRNLSLEYLVGALLNKVPPNENNLSTWLQVIANYSSSGNLKSFNSQQEIRRVHLVLGGDRDLAKHFLISAMLAQATDAATAGQLGYLKELSDADNRATGYSELDLLANHAGILFLGALRNAVQTGRVNEMADALMQGMKLFPSRKQIRELDSKGQIPNTESEAVNYLDQMEFFKTFPSNL